MLAPAQNGAMPLVGRLEEQTPPDVAPGRVATRGHALVLRGEPGIGKSRLLSVTERTARDRGMAVLDHGGVQSEAHLPFAGLHQLLRPVRERASELRDVQRAALDAAFGLTHEAAPEHFRIAMAALDLVSDVATDAPLLLVVEDAHWLDRPTSDALAFVARRIESDPIVLLAAIRDGYPSRARRGRAAGAPGCRPRRCDGRGAARCVGSGASGWRRAPACCVKRPATRSPFSSCRRSSVATRTSSGRSGGLPLTERLERAFADRVSDLPDATRLLLLVAALSDEDTLDEILEASTAVAGTAVDLDAAGPAVEAGIVDADLQRIRFRHPLIRSAVAQSASLAERRRVHEALAIVLDDQPDRRAWHRAALLSGEHEDIAARARGGGSAGAAAGRDPGGGHRDATRRRARRAGEAAAGACSPPPGSPWSSGGRTSWCRCSSEVSQLDLGELDRARVTWVEETALTRPLDAERFMSLIAAAEQAGAAGDHDLHVDLLWLVASRAWWVDPGPEVRRALDRRRTAGWGMRTRTTRASSRSTRTPIRWVTRPACWRACSARRMTNGSTPTPLASSGRPRSSSAPSTWGTTSSRRRSTACGRRDGSGICRGC